MRKRLSLVSVLIALGLGLPTGILAVQGLSAPTVIASPANVAFAKANLNELEPKMEAAERMAVRR